MTLTSTRKNSKMILKIVIASELNVKSSGTSLCSVKHLKIKWETKFRNLTTKWAITGIKVVIMKMQCPICKMSEIKQFPKLLIFSSKLSRCNSNRNKYNNSNTKLSRCLHLSKKFNLRCNLNKLINSLNIRVISNRFNSLQSNNKINLAKL